MPSPKDAEARLSLYTSPELNLRGRVWSDVEKEELFYFARQRGPELWPMTSKIMCPNLEKIMRSFIVIVQRGSDQLVDILLMGWW